MMRQVAVARRQPERTEQAHVIKLYRAIGATVFVMGTSRRKGARCPQCQAFVPNRDHGTHQTPGIPDLFVLLPPVPRVSSTPEPLFHEVKAPGGRLRPEQQQFRAQCLDAGVLHVVGGLNAAIEFLVRTGRARPESFPHYRVVR